MRKYTIVLIFTCSMLPLLDLLGQNWENQHPEPYQEELNDFFFIDTQKGWICGEDGLILVSADRGINWAKQNNRNNQDLNSICFIDEKSTYYPYRFWWRPGRSAIFR